MHTKILSEFEIKAHDIELIGTILRGILRDPDIVKDEDFNICISMVELVGNSSIYAHFPVSEDVRKIYLDAMSLVY